MRDLGLPPVGIRAARRGTQLSHEFRALHILL